MDENKNTKGIFTDDVKKAVAITLFFIFIFSIGSVVGSLIKTNKTVIASVNSSVADTQAQVQQTTRTPATTQKQEQPTSAQPTTAQNTEAKPSEAQPGESTAPTQGASGEMSTAEIIKLFNESANKVKTDATKVVKNYEKRNHHEEHLIVPSVIQGMANDLMEKNFKDDTEPIEYLTREEIVDQYQVPGVEWASCLTEAEVASASCKDNGNEYEISITLHPTDNPEPGTGVAKAFDTITTSEVMAEAPSFVTSFSTTYTDCTVKCKIDKATGRTTWSNYDSTVILKVKLNFLGNDLDAQVGMSFEKDYSITY